MLTEIRELNPDAKQDQQTCVSKEKLQVTPLHHAMKKGTGHAGEASRFIRFEIFKI
jgi:hypothetical protein